MTPLMSPLIAQVKQLRAQIEIAAANAVAHAHRLHTADQATLCALLPSSRWPNYGTLLRLPPSMHAAGASSWAVVTPFDWAAAPSAVPATRPLVPATTPLVPAKWRQRRAGHVRREFVHTGGLQTSGVG